MANFDPECQCAAPAIKCDAWGCRCETCGGHEPVEKTTPTIAGASEADRVRDALELHYRNRAGVEAWVQQEVNHLLAEGSPVASLIADIAALRTDRDKAVERAIEQQAREVVALGLPESAKWLLASKDKWHTRALAAEARVAQLEAENARLKGAVQGLLIWVDEPADDDDLCGIARQDRRVEAARLALKPQGASDAAS